ncbi:MAG: hypothetical protein JSV03_03925 [Planctomycetota bacterium]|nr:MAG: hypothetical protein JSV03_03925 [Planctomycetota bacterium]
MKTNMKKGMMAMLTMLAAATPATAGNFNLLLNINGNGRHGGNLTLGIGTARRQPIVVRRVWVAPVYKTVIERVWVPTVQTVYRDVPVTNIFGQVISYRREPYTIESGYWTVVQKQVLVRDGYWTTTPISPRLNPAVATVAVHGQPAISTTAPGFHPQYTGYIASATHNTLQNNRYSQPVIPPRAYKTEKYKTERKPYKETRQPRNSRESSRILAGNR